MIGLAAGLTGARAGTPTTAQPDEPEEDEPDADRQPDQETQPTLVSDRGARTEVSSRRLLLLRAARPGSAGVRTGRRADLGCAASRAAVGAANRDGTPAPCRLLAWCRASRGPGNNPHPSGHDLSCRPTGGRQWPAPARAQDRERARFIGAERARRAGALVDPVATEVWEEQAQQGRRSARPATRAQGAGSMDRGSREAQPSLGFRGGRTARHARPLRSGRRCRRPRPPRPRCRPGRPRTRDG